MATPMTEPVERKAYDSEITSACSSWDTALIRARSVTVSTPPSAIPATPKENTVVHRGVDNVESAIKLVARSMRSADIMISDTSSAQPSRHWIIDLSARKTGSLTLAFLLGHFSERRALYEASITQRFKFKHKRDDFRKLFAPEISEGRLIIVAWF
ncbi:hypothetical protein HO133_009451 [Letharia lupina]|uniref:Uncharacterized protein n=1 Tax=Letharia lupina TaxID=560253 RepID=A0A8H6CLT6_9LECA|nr:uncharacterized protein HO133_009451 [Letharia lupina]KAF6225451.1 hypothetical protein HO133_009451 [Letharia lupina]